MSLVVAAMVNDANNSNYIPIGDSNCFNLDGVVFVMSDHIL